MTNDEALTAVKAAVKDKKLTAAAAKNLKSWLTEEKYADYVPAMREHIEGGEWQILDDVFWTVIPFGTGGRRGRMYPFGSNAINDQTIGESAQGLANYVREALGPTAELSCAIARDTRHRSEEFSRLCAEIMAAAGFTVYFLRGFRSTPELSFTVRYKKCSCGIMVTASHNPPSDNAVKVYWSTGGQIVPPHDEAIIERVMNVDAIERIEFDQAVADGKIIFCETEVDPAFVEAVLTQSHEGPRDLRVLYSPLHGVGTTAVVPVLERAGFDNVEVFALHAEPSGDFPNVPGHVSNPENPAVFDSMIEHAKANGHDLCIATDPDCDRIGLAAPLTSNPGSEWATFSGNQIGALMCDYLLEQKKQARAIKEGAFIVETLVTTELTRRIADSYGVRTIGDLLVGFKWIAEAIDEFGPDKFLFGTEESHGYMAGVYTRDKDGAVASLLACEMAAQLRSKSKTLHEKLDDLFWQHGVHAERTVSVQMPGSEGMTRMKQVMQRFRDDPPTAIGETTVAQVRDYSNNTVTPAGGTPHPLEGPTGDLVILDTANPGNYVACRPSGTEPKIKFYMFAYTPPEQLANLETAKSECETRLDGMEASLREFAGV